MYSALWGSQRLIMVLVFAAVLLRYQNLLPLMYVFVILEICFRMVVGAIHPLTEHYYAQTPPGKLINLPVLLIPVLMLFLSLRSMGVRRSVT